MISYVLKCVHVPSWHRQRTDRFGGRRHKVTKAAPVAAPVAAAAVKGKAAAVAVVVGTGLVCTLVAVGYAVLPPFPFQPAAQTPPWGAGGGAGWVAGGIGAIGGARGAQAYQQGYQRGQPIHAPEPPALLLLGSGVAALLLAGAGRDR